VVWCAGSYTDEQDDDAGCGEQDPVGAHGQLAL